MGCPGQLTRTTTIPHGPLDILQAQEQVRHRGGDRRAHKGSNPGRGRNKSHDWPQQLDPQVVILIPIGVRGVDYLHQILKIRGWKVVVIAGQTRHFEQYIFLQRFVACASKRGEEWICMLRAHHILLCKSTSLLISECLPLSLYILMPLIYIVWDHL